MSSNTKPKTFKWYLCIGCKDILKKKKKKTPHTALKSIIYRSTRFPLYQIEIDLLPCRVKEFHINCQGHRLQGEFSLYEGAHCMQTALA